jgi:hypothetical protein
MGEIFIFATLVWAQTTPPPPPPPPKKKKNVLFTHLENDQKNQNGKK